MPASWTDDAIVLRTHNVGETDRFCILLTRNHGRVAARANGVRRLLSRRGGGLLPLHRINVTCESHSFGLTVSAANCLDAHSLSWRNPETFSCAQQGIELLLKLMGEGEAMPQVYQLACEFLHACPKQNTEILPSLFALKLLELLGLSPSMTHSSVSGRPFAANETVVFSTRLNGLALLSEDPSGRRLSPALAELLQQLDTLPLTHPVREPETVGRELAAMTYGLLAAELGSALSAPAVSRAMSSGLTPICHVN